MKMPRNLSPVVGTILAMVFVLSACVTINIYFPAAAAEKAAEKIVEDVLGTKPAVKPEQPPPPAGDKEGHVPHASSVAHLLLDFLVPPAHAATPNFDVDTPAIRQLQARMKARIPAVQAVESI